MFNFHLRKKRMQNKYELITENESKKPNYFYLLICGIFLSLLFLIIFLYNFAIPMKITPTFIHQKCEHQKCEHQNYEQQNSTDSLAIQEKNNILERKMENGLVELYYSLQNIVSANKIEDQMIRLMAISQEMLKGNEEWHKNILSKLGKQIQQKLKELQNPPDCRKARLLLIKWEKQQCGFGCILHFVSFGLVIAAASNRVLIIENDGNDELLCENGWNGLFEPITKCKYAESIGTNVNITAANFPIYSSPNQMDRIVWMPSRWQFGGFREIEHMPPIVPNEFMEFLQKHHPNPPAWFLGQEISTSPEFQLLRRHINKAKQRIQFKDGQPIVGIHVRRTDKNTEAGYHSLDEYIKWAQHWFDVEERRIELEGGNGLKKHKRRLFIATDEPTVILDARQRFNKYFQINAFDKHSQIAQNMDNRFSTVALKGMMAEIEMLIRCNFVVCTFSSNVCRLIYELMQALDGNAGNRVKSLDAFYDDWFYDHRMEAIEDYLPPNSSVIDAKKGDIFAISQVLWNGFVSARNLRTGKIGHFPTFLLKDHLKNATFPIFSDLILN